MTLKRIAWLLCRCPRLGRQLIARRALALGMWRPVIDALQPMPASNSVEAGRTRDSEFSVCFCRFLRHPCDSSLAYAAHRHYSTHQKTSTQILSKLFPQTSAEFSEEASFEQRQREEEEVREMERAWKRMQHGFGLFSVGGILFSLWAIYYFGKPALDEQGNEVYDEFSSLPQLQQYLARSWKSANQFQRFIQEPSSRKLLPEPLQPPYIQPAYTLVLEIKDLLVHPDWTYETGWRFKKRPGVDLFLEECAKHFEIVVYTAEQGTTVFPILEALDPKGYIMYRLVRDSTHFVEGHHVKNLDNLNRDLKRVVVVDWDRNATKLHPTNCFAIPRWAGNDDDTTLFDLVAFLRVLSTNGVDDVREVLQYYGQFRDPLGQFRENQRKLEEQMQADELEKSCKSRPVVKNWARGFKGN
ncbi:hypothetical protein KR032_012419 [Drosophila birchii]|nr:hypothetical protein KR032_012419 [Drosophila birchii]